MNDPNAYGNIIPTIPYFGDGFSLQEFADPPLNFDQVLHMMGGEAINPINNTNVNDHNFDAHIFSTENIQDNQNYNTPGDVFNTFDSPTMSITNNSLLNSLSRIDNNMINGENDEDEDDDEDNCGEAGHSSANNSYEPCKKGKVDRSRTLISERRRRGRMKEKLYALRALVPTITKMDKASIVGDAVLYLQDLQMQSKKLKSQIEYLESSFETEATFQAFVDTPKKNAPLLIPVCKIIMQVDVVQIEDQEFYVKVMSSKGQGVAASLYRAVHSLSSFIIKCSNLTTLCDQFVLTFTISIGQCMDDFSLINIKLWISGALLNHGFEFQSVHNASISNQV